MSWMCLRKLPNWNVLVRECAFKMQWEAVLSHCHDMTKAGVLIENPSLFPLIFKACTKLQYLKQGISVHAVVIKRGFDSYTSVANSLMDFYVKFRIIDFALHVFHCTENKDSISWNVMIHGYLDQGAVNEGLYFFAQARHAGFEPNISTLVLVLQACRRNGAIREGMTVHGFLIQNGFLAVLSVQNSMLSMYAEARDMFSARQLFDEMLERDVISWSVMISGYVQNKEAQVALLLFRDMCSLGGVKPDGPALVSILQACTSVGSIDQGRLIHGYIIRCGFEFDVLLGNALIDMYSKCMDIGSAYETFHSMPQMNTVSWNSILSGLVHNEKYAEAVALFGLMKKAGIEADEVTVVSLIQLSKQLGDAVQCMSIHSLIIQRGYEMNELVLNSLLDAYFKCELINLAGKLFDQMPERNLISWTTMIGGFAHCGKPEEAIALFREMKLSQEKPNVITMLSLLEACSILSDLSRSKSAHGLVIRSIMANEVAVGTALIGMYAKCGAIDVARRLFNIMPERNVVTWSAMIAAYGINGDAHDALALLREMELQGVKPNQVTMLSALSACSHGGLLEEGWSCFEEMIRDHGFDPSSEHYSCMVDMLGRAGDLNSAMEVIKMMPEGVKAEASVWGALLSACRNYKNSELGRGAAANVLELEPSNSAGYLIASSMFAADGLWADVATMRWLAKEKGVKVVPGYSLVHVGQRAYKFVAGDRAHPHSTEIYAVVDHLHGCMRGWEADCLLQYEDGVDLL